MKIAWFCSDPVVQGALGVTERIEGARYLLQRGHDVTMVCGAERGAIPFPDIPTVLIDTRYLPSLAWWFEWPGVVKTLRGDLGSADVAIADFALLPPVMGVVRARRKAGLVAPKVVLDVRTPPVEAGSFRTALQRSRFGLTLRWYGRDVDAITAITEGVRDYAARFARVQASTIPVFRSGSSWSEREMPVPIWPSELPGWLRERFIVLYHGTMTPGRGLFESIEALEITRRDAPDVVLVLLGAGSAVPALKERAARCRVADRVLFVDPVPQDRVPQFILNADVGLVPLPPVWEWQVSSPLKLAEYLSLGLPAIVTDIQAHRIVPRSAPYAFWSPTASPADLGRAILRAREGCRRPDVRADARRWAEQNLGWSTQLAVLEGVLDDVTAGRHWPVRAARM